MYRLFYWHKMYRQQNDYMPVILITGCSSGVGLALAKLFYLRSDYRVCVTARGADVDRLTKSFGQDDRFMILQMDVTSANERRHAVEIIKQRWGRIDILVNNAGVSYRSVVEHMTIEDEELQMTTNYFGPMDLIRLVLPSMREIGRGKIINISSVSGMLAMPTMASYSASKYALEGASEALWYELRPFGIDVSLIQPGFINSQSFQRVRYSRAAAESELGDEPYSEYYQSMKPFVEKLMGVSRTTPNKVALLVYDVIRTQGPPLWVPATFDAEIFYYLRRFLPRRILHPFLYAFLPGISNWGRSFSRKRTPLPFFRMVYLKVLRMFSVEM